MQNNTTTSTSASSHRTSSIVMAILLIVSRITGLGTTGKIPVTNSNLFQLSHILNTVRKLAIIKLLKNVNNRLKKSTSPIELICGEYKLELQRTLLRS